MYHFILCIVFLAVAIACLWVMAKVAQQQIRKLNRALEDSEQRRAELAEFLERFANGFRSEEGGMGALNAASRYVCEQTGTTSTAIYEVRDGYLNCLAVFGHYPLLRSRRENIRDRHALLDALKQEKIAVGDGYLGEVARTQRSELVTDPALDPRFSDYPGYADLGSVMAVPLFDGDVTKGVICAVGEQLSSASLTRLIQLVPQVLLVMNLMHTYEEISRRDRIDQELEFAHSLQTSLLPKSFPQWGMFSIDAATIPAKEVDGDFYDCIRIDDDRLLILLGDASGKGIPACMLSAMTRSFARSMVDNFTTLPAFLKELNAKLFRDTEADRFITLGCCLLNRRDSLLEFGRAGHTDLVEFVHQHLRLLSPDGAALGLLPEEVAEYETICIAMDAGTTVMMFSDGLTEALDKNGEEYGVRRLSEAFRRACEKELPLREVIEQVTGEVIAGQVEQADDQTILLIRHVGEAEA